MSEAKPLLPLVLALLSSVTGADLACPAGTAVTGEAPPKGLAQMCVLPDGRKHGPYKHWYSNGQLMQHFHYHHDKEHGLQQAWWPNGQLMTAGESVHGKRYKAFSYWDMAGNARAIALQVITEEHAVDDASPIRE